MLGLIELITLLLGIAGFSVGTNPTAPTPQQALEYAIADADLVAHVDVGAVVPGNYKVLTKLPNHPQIKASPELAKAVRKMVAEVEGPRGLAKTMTGIDLVTDVSDATAFVKIVPRKDPTFVVAAHGKFSTATIDKVAKLASATPVEAGGAAWFDAGSGNVIGVTRSGVLLAGTASLVKARLADTWRAPAIRAGTQLGHAAEVLGPKPVFALAVALSPSARAEALANLEGQNFLTDLIKRHKHWSFAVHRDGVSWSWIDNSRAGLDAMTQVSEGIIDVLRAAQIAPRGFAKILIGALESYRGNKHVAQLLRRKGDLWKIVDSYTGDGQFKAEVNKNPARLALTVRLTGKSLTEVLPLGSLVPFGAAAFISLKADVAPTSPPTSPRKVPAPRAAPLRR